MASAKKEIKKKGLGGGVSAGEEGGPALGKVETSSLLEEGLHTFADPGSLFPQSGRVVPLPLLQFLFLVFWRRG